MYPGHVPNLKLKCLYNLCTFEVPTASKLAAIEDAGLHLGSNPGHNQFRFTFSNGDTEIFQLREGNRGVEKG